ncbi:MAG: hypothetical protein WKF87_20970 [Chryseolinea sp.]
MKIIFLLDDGPYVSEGNYNALRTAIHLQKQDKSLHDIECPYVSSVAQKSTMDESFRSSLPKPLKLIYSTLKRKSKLEY